MKKLFIFILVLIGLYLVGTSIKEAAWFPFGEKGTQTESMKNIDLIDLNVSSSNTTIIPEDREHLKAKLEGRGKLVTYRKGDTIHVEVKRKWFQGFGFWNKSKVTVYIPKDYDQNMNVTVGSGNLTMSGTSKNHPMKLDKMNVNMSSGNLKLANLLVNDYNHKGSSGSAQLDSLSTKTGSIKMSSGKVDVTGYSGKLDATLSSGKLDFQMDKLTDSINVHVSSGSVKLDLPKDADFTLNGKASSGDISCDFPLKSQEIGNHKVRGTHGSGEHEIKVRVSSGNVDIY
ncbi:DUF4097 domain-containing protein [Heyndrickxia sporothermodurans]|nr:DUF4097 domain-containing protein [Heyndrickxia sporothermodurans]